MIFSELYSVYYNTVAKILTLALQPDTDKRAAEALVREHAFGESSLTILPALREGKWQLLAPDGSPTVQHPPSLPLTTLQKRWIKAISLDPRMALFGVELPDLEGIEPLFTPADYKVYDKYADGDPFTDAGYIERFRLLLIAAREQKTVKIEMCNRHGRRVWVRCRPKSFEYSGKDDKIRLIATGCRFSYFNLGRITGVRFCAERTEDTPCPPPEGIQRELVLEITDERNALERVMLHFAHFEKRAEQLDDSHFRLYIKYDAADETEMVIRVLSFGQMVRAVAPDDFVSLIKERLKQQKNRLQ